MDQDALLSYYREREEHTATLAGEAMEVQQELDEAEEQADPTLLRWVNLSEDDERCRVLTGFTCPEFLELLGQCEHAMPVIMGRGRRSPLTNHDKLLIVLCYVKHYETVEKLASTFSLSSTQAHRVLDETIHAITPVFYERYVIRVVDLIEQEPPAAGEFAEAKFVMDATLQEIWTPLGTYEERKRYYSGKHKLYGLKTQTLHLRNGVLVACWPGVPGAVHDLTIARDHLVDLRMYLSKEDVDNDEEENTWAVLVDSGYQGLAREVRAMGPFKQAAGRQLTIAQRNYNRRLAGQRVMCERWYGRLKTRCRLMASKYRNARDDYAFCFQLCAALTNFNILANPL